MQPDNKTTTTGSDAEESPFSATVLSEEVKAVLSSNEPDDARRERLTNMKSELERVCPATETPHSARSFAKSTMLWQPSTAPAVKRGHGRHMPWTKWIEAMRSRSAAGKFSKIGSRENAARALLTPHFL